MLLSVSVMVSTFPPKLTFATGMPEPPSKARKSLACVVVIASLSFTAIVPSSKPSPSVSVAICEKLSVMSEVTISRAFVVRPET